MGVMSNAEIRALLPHRFPFLLVDKVIAVEPGEKIVAIKNVTINEPFFAGHFPEFAVMPGVLIIEALAQASGLLIFKTKNRTNRAEGELFYLAGVDNARFKRMVVPGDQLQLEVEITKQKLDLWKFKGVATVEGELACSAEFMNIKGDSSSDK